MSRIIFRRLLSSMPLILAVAALLSCSKDIEVNTEGAAGTSASDGGVSQDPGTVPDTMLAISGKVMDKDTGDPIAGALVSTEPPIGQILTNSQGSYVFIATDYPGLKPSQLFRITASKDDYLADFSQVFVQPGHNKNIDILLTRGAASYYVILEPSALEFVDSDFTNAIAIKQVNVRLDTQTADKAAYSTNIDPSAQTWLKVEPSSGELSASPKFISVQVTNTSLPSGVTSAKASFIVGSDSHEVSVKVTLSAPNPDAG